MCAQRLCNENQLIAVNVCCFFFSLIWNQFLRNWLYALCNSKILSLHREANVYQPGGQIVFSKIRWLFISKSDRCEFFSFSIIIESLRCINFNEEWVARWGGNEPGCIYYIWE